jgi:hypothetical protein
MNGRTLWKRARIIALFIPAVFVYLYHYIGIAFSELFEDARKAWKETRASRLRDLQ